MLTSLLIKRKATKRRELMWEVRGAGVLPKGTGRARPGRREVETEK
jgi:hypothetical protein